MGRRHADDLRRPCLATALFPGSRIARHDRRSGGRAHRLTIGRISVVIATHNLARYVPEAVDSALGQTHAEREIIVVDDGSTDDTAERLEPYGARIRYIKQDHGGLAAARNHGLRLATGDYIPLLD